MNLQSTLLSYILPLPAILFSLSFHEASHAWMANKLGDPTSKNLGRISLDPTKHLDPIGFLCFVVFGFGWAKPVLVNSRNFKNARRDDLLTSLAGPVSNIILAIISAIIFGIYLKIVGINYISTKYIIVTQLLSTFVTVNVVLAVFNLLPIPPLDGYHVFKNILLKSIPYKFFIFVERNSMYILILMVFLLNTTNVLSGVMNFAINLVLNISRMFL